MRHLADLLAATPITTTAVGVDPKAKEATAFAVFANETLLGVTGPRVLGEDLDLRWGAANADASAASY
jgi:1,6-anhydro-N-acetylmuramate kinase